MAKKRRKKSNELYGGTPGKPTTKGGFPLFKFKKNLAKMVKLAKENHVPIPS